VPEISEAQRQHKLITLKSGGGQLNMGSRIATPPGLVVLICEECDWYVEDGHDGYLCVDARAALQRIAYRNRQGSAGNRRGVEAPISWHIYHAECDPVTAVIDRYYVRNISTSGDLLAATAQMLRLPWIGETNWPATLRRVLADTAGQAGIARHRPVRVNR